MSLSRIRPLLRSLMLCIVAFRDECIAIAPVAKSTDLRLANIVTAVTSTTTAAPFLRLELCHRRECPTTATEL